MQASSLTTKKKLWHKISLSTNRYLAIPNLIEFGLIFFKKQLDLQIKASNSIYIMGYSRKNPDRGGLRIYFFEKPLEVFIFLIYRWKFQIKQCSTPGNSTKFCQTPWKFQVEKQSPLLEIRQYFFLVTLGNSTSFLINPWKSHMLLLWYPCKFHILNPPVWIFSGIAQFIFQFHCLAVLLDWIRLRLRQAPCRQ